MHSQADARRAVRRSADPARGSATSSCWRGPSSTASSTACIARRSSARRSTSPSTAATSPATTSAASTGGCSRGPTAIYVKQYEADTNTNFSVLFDISKSMGFKSRGVSKLEYGSFSRRASPTWRTASATASASSPSTATSSRTCRRRRSISTSLLHTLDRAKAERPGNLAGPLNKMAEHFRRRSVLVLISDFYEEPDVILEAIKPLRFLGNELIVVPRARSGRDRLRLRRCVQLRGSRERRAAAGRAGVASGTSTAS